MSEEWITVTVCTKDRLHYLATMLSSLLSQTHQKWHLILLDASAEPVVNNECIERLLRIMRRYGHNVTYDTDSGRGIPQAYQQMMEKAETELLIRQEDDIWMEPECIERAYEALTKTDSLPCLPEMEGEVGAVGFMTPNYLTATTYLKAPNELENGFRKVESHPLAPNLPFIYEPCDQQEIIVHEDVVWSVCVLHAGSLYRRSAAEQVGGFCTHLSPIGHREESLFYSRMYMAGWSLLVRSTTRLWHFEATLGGSRPEGALAEARMNMRRSDESKFQSEMAELISQHPDRPLRIFE